MHRQCRIKAFPGSKARGGDEKPRCKCKKGWSTAEPPWLRARGGPSAGEGPQPRSSTAQPRRSHPCRRPPRLHPRDGWDRGLIPSDMFISPLHAAVNHTKTINSLFGFTNRSCPHIQGKILGRPDPGGWPCSAKHTGCSYRTQIEKRGEQKPTHRGRASPCRAVSTCKCLHSQPPPRLLYSCPCC